MTRLCGYLDRLIFWGLLAILVVAPTQYSAQLPGKVHVSLADPLVALVAGGALLRAICTGTWNRAWRIIPAPAVLFLLLGFASVWHAGNRGDALKDLIQYIEYFVVAYWLFADTLRNPQWRRCALIVFATAATVVVGIGLVQYWTPGVAGFEVRATFGNRNVYGGFLALALPLLLGILLHEDCRGRRVWLGLTILAGITTLLSGGSLLAIAFGSAVVAMFSGPRLFWAVAALVLLLVLAAPWLPRDNLAGAFDTIAAFDANGAPARRYTEWQAAAAMAQDNPWLGVGIGNYQENVGRYFGTLPAAAVKAEADSQCLHLVLASSLGIPALLCFLGLLLYHARLAAGVFFRTTAGVNCGPAIGVLGSIIAFNVNSLFAPLLVRGIGVTLVFVLALGAALAAGDDGGNAGY
jgi:O-antigen ligase